MTELHDRLWGLTDRGEALFHRLASAARAHDQRLRAGFDAEEIAVLERPLDRLRGNVPAGAAD